MKKIMIAAFVVCAAVVANAAAFVWSNTGGGPTAGKIYDSSSTLLAEGTKAYLFCTTDLTQGDFLTGLRGATDAAAYIQSKAIEGASATVNSAGRIALTTTEFDYGSSGNSYAFYYAILKGDEVLISDLATAQGQASATEAISFSGSASWSKASNGEAAFGNAGWYSAVPEPTSGLLLLFGIAGLALKRKKA